MTENWAAGTYTLGMQFKDSEGVWTSLDYHLAKWKNGRLTMYNRERSSHGPAFVEAGGDQPAVELGKLQPGFIRQVAGVSVWSTEA